MSRLSQREDGELVELAQGGNRDALNVLLERHYARVYSVCRSMCPNDADAADATQNALMGMVRGLARFDGRSSFGTWSYRIATNACLDLLRRTKRRPATSLDTGLAASSDNGGGRGTAGYIAEPSVPSRSDAVDSRIAVDAALERLPEEFRVPVVLRDLADLDYAEIAVALGVPVGTVKSRIARGRQQLAAILGNREPELDVRTLQDSVDRDRQPPRPTTTADPNEP